MQSDPTRDHHHRPASPNLIAGQSCLAPVRPGRHPPCAVVVMARAGSHAGAPPEAPAPASGQRRMVSSVSTGISWSASGRTRVAVTSETRRAILVLTHNPDVAQGVGPLRRLVAVLVAVGGVCAQSSRPRSRADRPRDGRVALGEQRSSDLESALETRSGSRCDQDAVARHDLR